MNCKICGAPVAEGQEYCEAHQSLCVAAEAGEVAEKRPSAKRGVLSLIFGAGALIPAIGGYVLSVLATAFSSALKGDKPFLSMDGCLALGYAGLFFTLCAIAMAVLSAVFGIGAIRLFVSAKRAKQPKPVLGLVLGIVGISHGAFAAIYGSIGLFVSLVWAIVTIVG